MTRCELKRGDLDATKGALVLWLLVLPYVPLGVALALLWGYWCTLAVVLILQCIIVSVVQSLTCCALPARVRTVLQCIARLAQRDLT